MKETVVSSLVERSEIFLYSSFITRIAFGHSENAGYSFFCESILNNRSRIRRRSARNARADCTMRSRLASWEMERCKLCVNSNSGLKCRKCSRFICEKYVRIAVVYPVCLTNTTSRQKYFLLKNNVSKLILTYNN